MQQLPVGPAGGAKQTPDTRHAGQGDYTEVYPPSEDSFLFLDCLDAEADFVRGWLRPRVVVEIGCGSGVISSHLATNILADGSCILCTDLNPAAAACTADTAVVNSARCLLPAVSDLARCLRPGCADLVLANPPYVPTPDEEVGAPGLTAAWAGGRDGRQVIDRLLDEADKLLAPPPHRVAFYLLMLRENRPAEVAEAMRARGYEARTVVERHCAGENLSVARFSRGT